MIRRADLSTAQRRLLAKLDDGQPHLDSVGREIGELGATENMMVRSLIRLGLAKADEGRGGRIWIRLTREGRTVLGEDELPGAN